MNVWCVLAICTGILLRTPDICGRWLIVCFSRCLKTPASQSVVREVGFSDMTSFPKCSPDLNAIEGVWARLKDLLEQSAPETLETLLEQRAPETLETRAAFLVRLRRTVRWMNVNLKEDLLSMCTDQHGRAREVLLLGGAKTEF